MHASVSSAIADTADRSSDIRALIGARRTYNRLDWWQPEDWLDSDVWTLAGADGALLIMPTDIDEVQSLSETHASVAWLRWCAVADGRSASGVMRSLFAQALPRLRERGVASVWAIADATDWIVPYLADAGFARADRMLTYQIGLAATDHWNAPPVSVRPIDRAQPDELKRVIALDELVFDEPWRYGWLLQRAYDQCQVFTVAMSGTDMLGYACAVCDGERGHIVRLAVTPTQRGRGLGTALLKQVADEVQALGARVLSLNTQQSNDASQRLYARLGFHRLIEQPFVLRLALDRAVS